ncbi:MAG: HAMP domain-containing histidine kinase [Bacilli bacterium]|nr:HAMP domain-containing histidine kinase [Bacilli bacterium]
MKNYFRNLDLKRQLGFIVIFSLILSLISLFLILPNLLTPFYEKNIYELLRGPLSFIEKDNKTMKNNDVAFIINSNDNLFISSNFTHYFNKTDAELINSITTKSYGKFNIDNKTYYYMKNIDDNKTIITLTDDSYIKSQQQMLSLIIFPVVSITILIVALTLIVWNNHLANKISKIKEKVDNLDNKNYDHSYTFKMNDEVNSLINSVEIMRKEIASKEEYKTSMYQSLSHELKTPIAVISSYVEACNDGVVSHDEALKTIDEEIKILSKDVSRILELNKINYLKDNNEHKNDKVDITDLLKDLTEKYKLQRRDVSWNLDIEDINIFRGTLDIWKVIIDNIYGNFVVYAEREVKVTIKDNYISFYNDGEPIDEKFMKEMFTEFKKGQKGKYGLGLSIVKQSVELYDYKIEVKNEKKGVLFKIY